MNFDGVPVPMQPIAFASGRGAIASVAAMKRPLYVRRQVLNADHIIAWAKSTGFQTTLPPEDMHVTCCFSKEPVDWWTFGVAPPRLSIAPSQHRTVQRLGDKGATVLRFESQVLQERHADFRRLGASWDYPEYHPHVTISYEGPENLDGVTPYAGPIELGPEIFEAITEGWHEGIKENSVQVDYRALARGLDQLEARALGALKDALTECRDVLVGKVNRAGDLAQLTRDLKQLPRFGDVQAEIRAMLERAWDAGVRDAGREVREQRRQFAGEDSSFTPRAAMKWLRATSFWVSGILGDRVLADAKAAILNGLKTGAGRAAIAEAVLAAFLPWLGDPTIIRDEEQLAPYRLETIVRTNTTTAYNHGRLTEFVDPEVVRFLKGVRYSAILDTRTTEVCRFLDGKVFKVSDPNLEALLPPNHYNCRSVIVPVVAGEKLDESQFITPAEVGQARELADQKFLTQTASAWRAYREAEE